MRLAVMPSFDRSTMLDEIKYGYYRAEMARPPRDPDRDDPAALKREQEGRVREEERFARESSQPAEERAHQRRADKAAYLRDKLAEAERAERE
ncbi:MAG TPA: hypothetical protein VNT55_00960 [Baekduia sp.]|nr:hypothetical protein [Baekduia sp.]